MLALLLSLLVFFLFSIIGLALQPKNLRKIDKNFGLFISPAIGLIYSILFIFTCNRLGLPIKELKIPLATAYIGVTIYGIFSRKIFVISRSTTLKFLVAPLGILLTAWPVLRYGFSWISYVNDDMNNYVLAAMRFYNFGFFAKPTSSLLAGSDYTQYYYFFHVLSGVRPGSEMYLSAFSILHSGDVLAIFMPAIMTLQLILIFTILAMSRTLIRPSKLKTRCAYALSISLPLTSLGYLYQLIGQVGGLSIGVGLLSISSIIFKQKSLKIFTPILLLLSIFLAAQLIWYPEFLPFILLPLLAKILFARREQRKRLWAGSIVVLIFGLLVLNKYFIQAVKFGASQIVGAQKSVTGVNANAQLFPYFLKPHGLVSYLGISPLNRWSSDPWESVSVVVSAIIISVILTVILRKKLYKDFPVSIFLLIFATFVYLVGKSNGFGAFKISMYVQPFLIITLSVLLELGLKNISARKYLLYIAIPLTISISILDIRTSEYYASASTGVSNNGFNEIPGGSGVGIEKTIASTILGHKGISTPIISTAMNLSEIKLEAIAGHGVPIIFPTTDVFANFYDATSFANGNIKRNYVEFKSKGYTNQFEQVAPSYGNNHGTSWILESNNRFEAINASYNSAVKGNWNYTLTKNPSNKLIFIDSAAGHSDYAWNSLRQKAVIFQPEKNPMSTGKYMQSIGDNLLFEVVNPGQNVDFVLNSSTTLIPQYERNIPKISLYGASQVVFPTMGHGSNRVYIPLPKPVVINGHSYVQLHIDQDLKPFPSRLSPISKIYGKNVELDSRRIALFVSNISIVKSSLLCLDGAPSALKEFPKDIENPNLYYSGIYEDGWIGSDSYFDLSDKSKTALVVSGSVPILKGNPGFRTVIQVSVDGKVVVSKNLVGGTFKITTPWESKGSSTNPKRVSIHFSSEQKLPSPDGRPASAQITFLGFK